MRIEHPSRIVLDPQQWAETLKRKAQQEAEERQLRYARITGKFTPTVEQL